MLDLDRLACDACRLLCDSAKNFLSMLLHVCFAYLGHLRVGRDQGGRQDRQHRNFGADPLGQGTPCWTAVPASFDPSVGIRIWVYIASS